MKLKSVKEWLLRIGRVVRRKPQKRIYHTFVCPNPYCGWRVDELEIELARYDYQCPRCRRTTMSQFTYCDNGVQHAGVSDVLMW